MAMRIGCDNLVYAKMTTEDTATTAPVYDEIVSAPGVMHININPNASLATAFYDDGPGETASTLGNIDVEIQKNALTSKNKADLLGHTIDANGGVVYGDNDTPPWVAIGFRTLKSNGKYRYVWLYKGRFADPEDNNETKADSINFQSDTIKGQFVKLSYPVTVATGVTKRVWKYEVDSDTPTANQGVMDTWFNDVVFPAASSTPAPTLTVAYAQGTASGTTKATITGAAGAGNKFAYKLQAGAFATPNVGDATSGLTDYTSGADIPATAGQYLGIYEVTATNTVVKFTSHQVIADEIN